MTQLTHSRAGQNHSLESRCTLGVPSGTATESTRFGLTCCGGEVWNMLITGSPEEGLSVGGHWYRRIPASKVCSQTVLLWKEKSVGPLELGVKVRWHSPWQSRYFLKRLPHKPRPVPCMFSALGGFVFAQTGTLMDAVGRATYAQAPKERQMVAGGAVPASPPRADEGGRTPGRQERTLTFFSSSSQPRRGGRKTSRCHIARHTTI